MKTARLWFLLLLAVLLPVRGALGAAMLCSMGGGVQAELRMQVPSPAHALSDDAMAHGHGASHDHGAHDHGAHGHSSDDPAGPAHGHHANDQGAQPQPGQDKCNMCAAYCCSLTPLVSSAPILPGPLDRAAVKFSDLTAPPPNFFSDGQERPPRTI